MLPPTVGFKKATTLKKSDWEDVLGSWVVEITINFYTIGTKSRKKFVGMSEISVHTCAHYSNENSNTCFLGRCDGIDYSSP